MLFNVDNIFNIVRVPDNCSLFYRVFLWKHKITTNSPQYVEEDKHFLLERLLNFEKPPLSPQQTPDLSDSDPESTTPSKKSKSGVSPLHPGFLNFIFSCPEQLNR